jgi:hypothetical protein
MLDKGVERRGPPKPAGPLAQLAMALGRLVLPVAALLGAFAALWLFRFEPAHGFDFLGQIDGALDPEASAWPAWGGTGPLTLGLVLQPLIYVVLNLVNRRYGAGLTLWTVFIGWAAAAGGVYWVLSQGLLGSFETGVAPVPYAVALGLSVFAGQVLAIYFFDWLRGIPWWEAPLVAALVGGLGQTVIFHLAMHYQVSGSFDGLLDGDALPRLLALGGLQLAWAVGQLLPTAMLRGAIRPLPGYGGA